VYWKVPKTLTQIFTRKNRWPLADKICVNLVLKFCFIYFYKILTYNKMYSIQGNTKEFRNHFPNSSQNFAFKNEYKLSRTFQFSQIPESQTFSNVNRMKTTLGIDMNIRDKNGCFLKSKQNFELKMNSNSPGFVSNYFQIPKDIKCLCLNRIN